MADIPFFSLVVERKEGKKGGPKDTCLRFLLEGCRYHGIIVLLMKCGETFDCEKLQVQIIQTKVVLVVYW